MAKIENLSPGQVLYESRRETIGGTIRRQTVVVEVEVVSVDLAKRQVTASIRGADPEDHSETKVSKWRVKRPTQPRRLV